MVSINLLLIGLKVTVAISKKIISSWSFSLRLVLFCKSPRFLDYLLTLIVGYIL